MAPSNVPPPFHVWRPQMNWFWYLERTQKCNIWLFGRFSSSLFDDFGLPFLDLNAAVLAKASWFPQNNWQFVPEFGFGVSNFWVSPLFWHVHLLIQHVLCTKLIVKRCGICISSLLLGEWWSPVIYSDLSGVGEKPFIMGLYEGNIYRKALHWKDWMQVLVFFLLNRMGL